MTRFFTVRIWALLLAMIVFGVFSYLTIAHIEVLEEIVGSFLSDFPLFSMDPARTASYAMFVAFFVSAIFAYAIYGLVIDLFLESKAGRKSTAEIFVSREEFRNLYEYSPMPYLVLNKKGEIDRPNASALRLFKTDKTGLENKLFASYVTEESKIDFEDAVERFRRGITVRDKEIQIKRSDGVPRWVMLAIFPSNVPTEGLRGFTALVDITEQKEIDKAKTEFVSLASHQLRSPLTALSWYTESLTAADGKNLNNKQRDYLIKIRKRNQEMIELVEALLNISRIEVGKIAVTPEKTNVLEVTKSVAEELENEISKKQISFKLDYQSQVAEINTDPKLLRIIIQNLLSNALKYTPENGSVRLSVRDAGRDLIIEITDNGYGIPPEAKEKIFTKMFRAENVKSKEVNGTGLGLYMTKSFVELLGGKIGFESELDQGTTFTVSLPNK